MYFVLTIAKNYPNSYWLKYDWKNNPDYLDFLDEKPFKSKKKINLYLDEKVNRSRFLKYDYVLSDAVKLFSQKMRDVISMICPSDLQLVKATVHQGNDLVGTYYIPIVLNVINCIDDQESKFDSDIQDYTKIAFLPGSLHKHNIVKAKGYEGKNFVVSKTLVEACNEAGIHGIEFHQEPFTNPLYTLS